MAKIYKSFCVCVCVPCSSVVSNNYYLVISYYLMS